VFERQRVNRGSSSSYTVRQYTPVASIPTRDNGSGDPNSASSFHAVPSPGGHYTDWIGNYLFFRPVGR
jgi:hypothetical protein